jgi:RNA polymerase sigma-70 factor (ECF subfamily)
LSLDVTFFPKGAPYKAVQAEATSESKDALEAVYRTNGERIWRAVLAYTQDREVADDAVAEAFAQALARGAAVRTPASWVWRAAFRIAAGMLNERVRSVGLQGTESYEMPETGSLVMSLAKLPAKQRAALVLFYYGDYPIRDIADILRSNALAVRVNLSRGRKRLGRMLEADHV